MNVRHIRLACAGGQLLQWTLLFETLIKMFLSYKKKKAKLLISSLPREVRELFP